MSYFEFNDQSQNNTTNDNKPHKPLMDREIIQADNKGINQGGDLEMNLESDLEVNLNPTNSDAGSDSIITAAEPITETTTDLHREYSSATLKEFLESAQRKGKKDRIIPSQLVTLDRFSFSFSRDWKVILASFLTPMIILFIAYMSQGFVPVGDKSPLTVDLYHQYAPFISALRTKILAGESLWYSWNGGLGYNFFGTFAYYLTSPFNFLFALLPVQTLPQFIMFLQLIKIGLAGLTFALLLRVGLAKTPAEKAREALKEQDSEELANLLPEGGFIDQDKQTLEINQFWLECQDEQGLINRQKQLKRRRNIDEDNRHFDGQQFGVFICAILYALSGYIMSYAWNIMWLDVLVVFPLVVLGIHKLVNQGKISLYIISLALCIYLNYYLSIFVCIFNVFYFLYYMGTTSRGYDNLGNKKWSLGSFRVFQMLLASLIAGSLTAIITLPTYEALHYTSAINDAFPTNLHFDFSILDFISKHLLGSHVDIRSGLPNIYCGILVMTSLPVYLSLKRISIIEKIGTVLFLIFMFISFNLNILNFLWHGMHYPNQLPHRFAFVYVLLSLTILFRIIQNLKDIKPIAVIVTGILNACYLLVAEVVLAEEVSHEMVYLNLLFLVIYILILLAGVKRQLTLKLMTALMTILILGEVAINTIIQTNDIAIHEYFTSSSAYTEDFDQIKKINDELFMDDNSFYRVEMTERKTTDDPALYGFKGLTVFSSTVSQEVTKTMAKLGYSSNNLNSYIQDRANPVTDMLLGIKYLIKKNPANDPTLTKLALTSTADLDIPYNVYQRKYVLPVGYLVDSSVNDIQLIGSNALINQNDLIKAMTGQTEPVLLDLDLRVGENTNYQVDTITNSISGVRLNPVDEHKNSQASLEMSPLYSGNVSLYVNNECPVSIKVSSNNDPLLEQSIDINQPQIIDLGYVAEGQKVQIVLSNKNNDNNKNIEVYCARLSEQALAKAYQTLMANPFVVTAYNSNNIIGQINSDKDGVLFFSIPYDPNWNIKVDKQEVMPIKVSNAFIALPITHGQHEISLMYQPRSLRLALYITVTALASFILLGLISIFVRRKQESEI